MLPDASTATEWRLSLDVPPKLLAQAKVPSSLTLKRAMSRDPAEFKATPPMDVEVLNSDPTTIPPDGRATTALAKSELAPPYCRAQRTPPCPSTLSTTRSLKLPPATVNVDEPKVTEFSKSPMR